MSRSRFAVAGLVGLGFLGTVVALVWFVPASQPWLEAVGVLALGIKAFLIGCRGAAAKQPRRRWYRQVVARWLAARSTSRMSASNPFRSNVVDCRWQRTSDRWRLWVHGLPEVEGLAATCSAALEALIEAIREAAPDPDEIDPVVPEFWPPLPAGAFAERYLQPALRLVSGDTIFEAETGPKLLGRSASALGVSGPLFRDGICPVCNCGRGPRTDVPIRIATPPPDADGGWIRAAFGDLLRVYSQEFLDLLSAAERGRLSLLPVELPPSDRRRFLELRGPAHLQPVGVRDLQADGQECPECGRREVRVVDPRLRAPGSILRTFVCAVDLSAPLPTVSTVGFGNEVALCVTQDRWTELRANRRANRRASGLLTEPLGLVAAADCERQPRVRVWNEACDACCHWPAPRTISDQQMAVFELPAEQCSRRNFTWLAEAERDGLVQIVSSTLPPLELYELSQQPGPPERTEFVGLRCPRCGRLGWIVLSPDPPELSCVW